MSYAPGFAQLCFLGSKPSNPTSRDTHRLTPKAGYDSARKAPNSPPTRPSIAASRCESRPKPVCRPLFSRIRTGENRRVAAGPRNLSSSTAQPDAAAGSPGRQHASVNQNREKHRVKQRTRPRSLALVYMRGQDGRSVTRVTHTLSYVVGRRSVPGWARHALDQRPSPTKRSFTLKEGNQMYKHILVATDGSELALKGLDHGLALAKALEAKLTILTVSVPLREEAVKAAQLAGIGDVALRYDQQLSDTMKEHFAPVKERARDQNVEVNMLGEIDDSPAEAIVRTAKLNDCDLIVMSSHGRRGVQKMLLGSQTSEVLVKTPIPVLVIR